MSDADDALRSLRERLAGSGEDRLGNALSELLENPLFTGAVTCAFDARELAVHAQEMAMTLLNVPSAADIERLTRRLRSLSQRMEGVEDALYRMESLLSGGGVEGRLVSIESQLTALLGRFASPPAERPAAPRPATRPPARPRPETQRPGTAPPATPRPATAPPATARPATAPRAAPRPVAPSAPEAGGQAAESQAGDSPVADSPAEPAPKAPPRARPASGRATKEKGS